MSRVFNARRVGALAAALALAVLAAAPARAETIRIAVLGDSLVAGYGLPEAEGFVPQLEAALKARGHDVDVLNAGVSGDTTAGGLSRLEWTLGDRPHAMIVSLGANDMLRAVDPASSRRNLDAILARLGEARIPVLLAGMRASPNLGRAYVDAFDGMYPALADAHGTLLYPFFLEGVATVRDLNQDDGIHPNRRGVAAIVERIVPHVERLIERVRGG
jgi:acyl-CoA thioesterase-1